MNKKVNLGVSGAGYIARRHGEKAKHSPDVQIIAVCDIDIGKANVFAKNFGDIEGVYQDYEDFLNHPELDAVIIATPPCFHDQMTIAALEAGKHAFTEKPMATNLKQAAEISKVARMNGRIFQIGFVRRYMPALEKLKEMVSDKTLGRTYAARIIYNTPFRAPQGRWYTDPKMSGGGSLIDLSHGINSILYALSDPEPLRVTAWLSTNHSLIAVEDTAMLILELEGNVIAYIESSWSTPIEGGELTLLGTQGSAYVTWTDGKIKATVETEEEGMWQTYEPLDVPANVDIFQRQLDHFVHCIKTGETPRSSIPDGFATQLIVEGAYRSHELDSTPVDLNELAAAYIDAMQEPSLSTLAKEFEVSMVQLASLRS